MQEVGDRLKIAREERDFTQSVVATRTKMIDPDGKVAYKGGRGPFGFRSGEMEQALLMLLLERKLQTLPIKP